MGELGSALRACTSGRNQAPGELGYALRACGRGRLGLRTKPGPMGARLCATRLRVQNAVEVMLKFNRCVLRNSQECGNRHAGRAASAGYPICPQGPGTMLAPSEAIGRNRFSGRNFKIKNLNST